MMIRMLDHTADVGFEIEALTLEALFDEARRALLLTGFERPSEQGEEERSMHVSAPDLETLLVRWINELIYLVQDAGFVPASARVWVREDGAEAFSADALLAGSPLDLEGCGWQGEIKGATFHGLAVVREEERWRARVILDV